MPRTAPSEPGDHAALDAQGDYAAHSGHAHDAPPSTDEFSSPDHSPAHQSSLCVFSVGGTANAPAPQMAALLDVSAVDLPIDFLADPELNSLPILIDRIRGPPSA
jgi:hypothetical protein